jgi:dihydrodipicolinate synthase/N-acetylneuraminate lyase
MPAAPGCPWSGVFPAATTQFDAAGNVDLAATSAVQQALVRDGVHGLVLLGTVGENNSLSAEEKRAVLAAAVQAVRGKVPLIRACPSSRPRAPQPTRAMRERIGVNGLMVLPAMVYVPTDAELEQHFQDCCARDRPAHHALQQSARLSRQH